MKILKIVVSIMTLLMFFAIWLIFLIKTRINISIHLDYIIYIIIINITIVNNIQLLGSYFKLKTNIYCSLISYKLNFITSALLLLLIKYFPEMFNDTPLTMLEKELFVIAVITGIIMMYEMRKHTKNTEKVPLPGILTICKIKKPLKISDIFTCTGYILINVVIIYFMIYNALNNILYCIYLNICFYCFLLLTAEILFENKKIKKRLLVLINGIMCALIMFIAMINKPHDNIISILVEIVCVFALLACIIQIYKENKQGSISLEIFNDT